MAALRAKDPELFDLPASLQAASAPIQALAALIGQHCLGGESAGVHDAVDALPAPTEGAAS